MSLSVDRPVSGEVGTASELRHRVRVGGVLPGLAVAGGIAVVATALAPLAPVVGAPVIAILLGVVISAVWHPSATLKPGIAFASRRVLQGSIVVLGSGLSLGQVLSTGGRSLPVLVGSLLAVLATAWLAGRLLGLPDDLRTLIGVGTAICGASAIAAADSVIGADESDVSYAVATIFTFNVVAVVSFPALGHLMGLSSRAFGLWSGTAINDLSSVVAASSVYGHSAASYAVIVKLTRTLAIVPISLALAALRTRRQVGQTRPKLLRVMPLFIVAFVAAVIANTLGAVPTGWHHSLSELSLWMITTALAAIGLSTDFGRIRRAGLRPLGLGAILWVTVGMVSLGLQGITGTL